MHQAFSQTLGTQLARILLSEVHHLVFLGTWHFDREFVFLYFIDEIMEGEIMINKYVRKIKTRKSKL